MPRSDLSSTSSSRSPYLRAGRATDDTCFNRPAPATQSLNVGLPRPCQEQACAVMLGAMARMALARHAAEGVSRIVRLFAGFSSRRATTNKV
jgi:hypothetical protein